MRFLGTALLALALAFTARADEPTDAAAEVGAELDRLDTDFAAAMQDLMARYRAARAAGEKFDYRGNHPGATFVPRWQALAKAHAGTEHAARALAAIAKNSVDWQQRQEVAAQVAREHPRSPHVKAVVNLLGSRPDLLRMLAEKNPDRDVQGVALFLVGQQLVDGDAAAARKQLTAVKEKYGDVMLWGRFKLADRVDGILFELDHLQVGHTAPDIEGEDVDGVAFKMSDYRGKVIFLDFWGDW